MKEQQIVYHTQREREREREQPCKPHTHTPLPGAYVERDETRRVWAAGGRKGTEEVGETKRRTDGWTAA